MYFFYFSKKISGTLVQAVLHWKLVWKYVFQQYTVPGMGERRHAGNSHVDRLELLKLRRDRTQRVVHLQHDLPLHLVQYCWSGMFIPDPRSECFPSPIRMFSIPDPNFFHPGSRIRIKKFKYFNPKNWFPSSGKYDTACSFRIPDPVILPIPDPGVEKAPATRSGSATLFSPPLFSVPYHFIDKKGWKTVILLQLVARHPLLYLVTQILSLYMTFCEEKIFLLYWTRYLPCNKGRYFSDLPLPR